MEDISNQTDMDQVQDNLPMVENPIDDSESEDDASEITSGPNKSRKKGGYFIPAPSLERTS